MLQRVYTAFDAAGTQPEAVFLDRCATSVALAEWYADRTNRSITGQTCNILDFQEEPFDIICTHSYMGYFTDEQRQQLARKWAALLRPGGKVVTINRIRPNMTGLIGFSRDQARKFVECVRQASLPAGLDISAEHLAQAATVYTEKFHIRPVASIGVPERFFENNGFTIDVMDGKIVSGHEGKRDSGPTTPDGANYVHMIATRQ